MRRRFWFGYAPPKGPPGSVVPDRLNEAGLVICPRCGNLCGTPMEPNPYRMFIEEPMILVGGKTARCPHCHAVHLISHQLAREFNHRLYSDDPAFAPDEDD